LGLNEAKPRRSREAKRRQHRSVSEAFQRSSGSKDAEQDGAINFVRVLTFENVFNRETPRERFPPIKEPHIPPKDESIYDNDDLNDLQLSIVKGAHHLAVYSQKTNKRVPKPHRVKKMKHAKKHLKHMSDNFIK
jgi:hypothetical protein